MITQSEIDAYIDRVQKAHNKQYDERYPSLPYPEFSINQGRKYAKVIIKSGSSRSVFCFIDNEGNLYKADTWSRPAKGIRGHINDANAPLFGKDFYIKY